MLLLLGVLASQLLAALVYEATSRDPLVLIGAVASMTLLNAGASQAALAAGVRAATDVTGFGLLGHLFKLARASGVTALLDHAAVPLIDGAGNCWISVSVRLLSSLR